MKQINIAKASLITLCLAVGLRALAQNCSIIPSRIILPDCSGYSGDSSCQEEVYPVAVICIAGGHSGCIVYQFTQPEIISITQYSGTCVGGSCNLGAGQNVNVNLGFEMLPNPSCSG
jgi:hypothetical protein